MTTTFAHIACCVDHSDASMHALDQAVRLHESGGGRLTVVHVAPWPMVIAGHGAAWVPDPAVILDGAREWLDGVVATPPGRRVRPPRGLPARRGMRLGRERRGGPDGGLVEPWTVRSGPARELRRLPRAQRPVCRAAHTAGSDNGARGHEGGRRARVRGVTATSAGPWRGVRTTQCPVSDDAD